MMDELWDKNEAREPDSALAGRQRFFIPTPNVAVMVVFCCSLPFPLIIIINQCDSSFKQPA